LQRTEAKEKLWLLARVWLNFKQYRHLLKLSKKYDYNVSKYTNKRMFWHLNTYIYELQET